MDGLCSTCRCSIATATECTARNDRNTAAGAIKHNIKERGDSAHLLLPPLARVAGLCCPSPLIRVHLGARHGEATVILLLPRAGAGFVGFFSRNDLTDDG